MDDGQPKGIDTDILSEIVKQANLRASFEILPRNALISRLQDGTCELALGLKDAPNFRQYGDLLFTIPLYYSTSSLFTKKPEPAEVSSIRHLFDLKIAYKKGKELSLGLQQAAQDKRLELLSFNTLDQGYQLLDKDLVDAILSDDVSFRYQMKLQNKQDKFRRISIPILPHQPSFIVLSHKIDDEKKENLRLQLQAVLKNLHLDGKLNKIIKSYVYE